MRFFTAAWIRSSSKPVAMVPTTSCSSVAVLVQTQSPLVPAVPVRLVLDRAMSLADAAAERGDVAGRIGVRAERSHPQDIGEQLAG